MSCLTNQCPRQEKTQCFDSPEQLEKSADFLKALGHPIRLAIVEMLIEGERCVCELHANSGRDMSTISSHLKTLRTAGVINGTQRGKNIYYSLICPCISTILSCIKGSISKGS